MSTNRSTRTAGMHILFQHLQAGAALACACVCAIVLPTALTWLLLWAACRIECSKAGWLAISYAHMPAFLVATTLMALLGYFAYRKHQRLAPKNRHKHLAVAYGAACTFALLLAGAIPATGPAADWLSAMVAHIAKQL